MIVDDPIRIAPGLAAVPDNLSGRSPFRINSDVIRPQRHVRRQARPEIVGFLLAEILRDLERQDPSIVIMPFDQVVGNFQRAAEQFLGDLNFFVRVGEQLRVGKIERRRETDREIKHQPVLGEWHAVAVRNQAARRRDIEHIGSRQLLGFERRDDCLFHGGADDGRRGRFDLREQDRRCLNEKQKDCRGSELHKRKCAGHA